ncbi:MAG: acyl-CoA desaturase [Bacteriovoracaceae bacterium]|nr:acyl-CoA desaturase [Bacteriovoracaceae bacterium]
MKIILFFAIHWYVSVFCQTFYLHRYCSHKLFDLTPFWQKFFHFLTWMAQGASYLNPDAYAYMHMQHHYHSDGPQDPHSPIQAKNPIKFMLKTYAYYNEVCKRLAAEGKISKFDRFADSRYVRIAWLAFYIFIYVQFAPSPYFYFLLPFHFIMGPIHGFIVNWFGHKLGYQNFDNGDYSRNTLFWDFVTVGELFQNNHHKNMQKPCFSHRWFEFDVTYYFIEIFHFLGIVKKINENRT